ncbi:MAG: hypothetical protein SVS15_02520, partial [Thermodesulfobacteriota bacterium]|nr:hypothetical protein [Thermodesulfobacteriota bacterium]
MKVRKTGKLSVLLVIMIASCLLAGLWASPAWATDRYWIADDGWWSDPANWNTSGLPQDGDDAYLTSNDGTSRTVTYDAASYPLLDNLYIDATGSGTMSLVIFHETRLFADDEYVGYSGTGAFTQARETNSITSGLYLGYESGSSGTYDLSGTGELSSGLHEYVGYQGAGAFTQSGGTNSITSSLYLGHESGSSGTYDLSGGTLEAHFESIGNSGTGEFTQTGGANSATFGLAIGHLDGSSGTYNLSGGTLSAQYENVGTQGTGEFFQTGGTHSVTEELRVGCSAGGQGTYDLSGDGELTVNWAYIGQQGTGVFKQSGGTHTVGGSSSYLVLGYYSGGLGTYELSGGTLDSSHAIIGHEGTGEFVQTGGEHLTSGIWLGHGAMDSKGTYDLSGGSLEVINTASIGTQGTGEFTQTGGTNTIEGFLRLGYESGSSGTYDLSGGSLSVGGDEQIGFFLGTGEFIQTGGTHTVTGTLYVGSGSYGGVGTFNLSGAEVSAGTVDVAGTGTMNLSGGTVSAGEGGLNNQGAVNLSGAPNTINGDVVNHGTFTATETTVSFTGSYTENGIYISDPSTNNFSDWTIGQTGYVTAGLGDIFNVAGDFINNSLEAGLWDTDQASLSLSGGMHQMALAGADMGLGGYTDNFAWGEFSLESGAILSLSDGNAEEGAALYVGLVSFEDGLSQLKSILSEYNIYYNANLLGNEWLGGETY